MSYNSELKRRKLITFFIFTVDHKLTSSSLEAVQLRIRYGYKVKFLDKKLKKFSVLFQFFRKNLLHNLKVYVFSAK